MQGPRPSHSSTLFNNHARPVMSVRMCVWRHACCSWAQVSLKVIFSEHRRRTQGARLSHLSTHFNNVTIPHLLLQRMFVWSLASWHDAFLSSHTHTVNSTPHDPLLLRSSLAFSLRLRDWAAALVCVCVNESRCCFPVQCAPVSTRFS